MNIKIEQATKQDKKFVLKANNEINKASGLIGSKLIDNIDKDIFGEDKLCHCLVAKHEGKTIGMTLYSYVYWARLGKGIYWSQAYVEPEYRKNGILREFLNYIIESERDCNFITGLVGTENDVMQKCFDKLSFSRSKLITYYKIIN
jgi:GNAT superfamily N-acetyltransferase